MWAWIISIGVVAAAALLWPGVGVLAGWRRWRAFREREQLEDVLKHLVDCQHEGQQATPQSVAGSLGLRQGRTMAVIGGMERKGLLVAAKGGLRLTPEGERWALQVVRAHRLWERYLADEARLPLSKIHRAAHRAEHSMTSDEVDALDAHLGHPLNDPHGDPIPDAAGVLARPETVRLTEWPTDQPGRIVHIEDEPEVIYKQITAGGLRPGNVVRVLDSTPERLLVTDGQDEHRLAPVVAANIQVVAAPEAKRAESGLMPLSDLPDGEERTIAAIDPACRGFTRRRLLDMGLTPGTRVRAELRNAFGDPRGFRVRGSLVALRREQAAQVWITRNHGGEVGGVQG